MAANNTFREWAATFAPAWARTGFYGSRLFDIFALVADELGDALVLGVKLPWLGLDDYNPESLGFIGLERNLPRYPAESEANYRTRLRIAWSIWTSAGTKAGIEAAFSFYGLDRGGFTAEVKESFDPNWAWEWPKSDHWSRFWVVINQPHSYTWPSWGSMVWGAFTWGMTPDDTATLLDIANRFRPAHVVCEAIVLVGPGSPPIWGVNITWGSFTWGTPSGSVAIIPGRG